MFFGGRLGPWALLRSGNAVCDRPNAADLYRQAFAWVEALPREESERLCKAVTIAVNNEQVKGLLQKARPALEALHAAVEVDRCCWATKPVTSSDLGKGYLDVTNLNVIRVACLSARRKATLGQGRSAWMTCSRAYH